MAKKQEEQKIEKKQELSDEEVSQVAGGANVLEAENMTNDILSKRDVLKQSLKTGSKYWKA